MNFWMTLWKIVFIGGVAVFALMAVFVTVGGFADIRRLLRGLGSRRSEED
jgi:hypothetical protein